MSKKRDRSAKSTAARARRRASKPGRANQPVPTIHNTITTGSKVPPLQDCVAGDPRAVTAEPARLVGITPPTITFVHFQNETRVYVDGILRRTVDRHVGHHIQRVVEGIEAAGAVKIAEQRLDNLVNDRDIFGSARR